MVVYWGGDVWLCYKHVLTFKLANTFFFQKSKTRRLDRRNGYWCMMHDEGKEVFDNRQTFPKNTLLNDNSGQSRSESNSTRSKGEREKNCWSMVVVVIQIESNYSRVGFRINKERFLTFFSYRFIASTRSNENSRLDFAKSVIAACLEFLKCPSWFIHVMEPKKKKETVQRSKPITVIKKKAHSTVYHATFHGRWT